MQALLETITGLDRGSRVYALVITADCKSVERDLKAHYQNIDSALGMPVEKYLFDAMRRLVKSGQWTVNEKGARLWRFEDGLHIVWRSGAQDIVTLLTKDKVPGIPRDEDTLADILIERGLAIPKTWSDGRQYRYWQMQPEILDNPLYLLRLKSAELIFSSEPPVVIAAHEIDEPYSNIIETDPVSNPAQPINKQVKAKSVAVLKQSQQDENPKPIVLRSIQQDTAHDLSALPDLQVSELTQSIQDSQGTNNMNTISPNVDQQLMPSECSNIIPSSYETVEPENTIASQIQSTCEPVDNSKCWLENQGDAGQWLIDIASMLNQGQWHLDRDILYVQDKYLLPFPATAEKLTIDPPQFIKTLEGNGWLVTDVMSPMRKVQIIQSVRGVLLALEPSLALNALLKFRDNSLLTASSAQTPSSNKDKTRDEFKSSQAQKETGGEPKPKRSKSNSTGKQNLITDKASDSSVNSQSDKTNNLLPLPPVKSGTIDLLITYVRQQNIPSDESSPDNNWHTVSNIELEQFLTQHSTIKRTRLMIDIANHPDCRSVSAAEGIQVRLHP